MSNQYEHCEAIARPNLRQGHRKKPTARSRKGVSNIVALLNDRSSRRGRRASSIYRRHPWGQLSEIGQVFVARLLRTREYC